LLLQLTLLKLFFLQLTLLRCQELFLLQMPPLE
jgi:hypothetical protein